MRPLQIAVAGAGIGGLSAAIALRLSGHHVQIFDRFETPEPVGSGLVVQPVGQRVLDWLGAGAAAQALGARITTLHGTEARTGIESLSVRYDRGAPGRYGLGMHRASLFAVLHDRLIALGLRVETGCEVQASSVIAGQRVLHLTDGQRLGGFDLVVDALGSHSPLSPLNPPALPYGALWTTLQWPVGTQISNDHLSQHYVAARRMVGVLPIGRLPEDPTPRAAFFWSLRGDALADWQRQPLATWKDEALSIWPALAPFLAQITEPAQLVFARYAHGTLRKPWADGLVHLGDSAHRTSPQLGQGANMALLDALALARALAQAPLADALPLFARMRRGHLRIYQAMSRFLTPQYQSDSAAVAVLRDRVVSPLARIWPAPRIMGAIASGLIVPPLGGEPYRNGQPVPPDWAVDALPDQ